MIARGFSNPSRLLNLARYPAVFDLVATAITLLAFGFAGASEFTIKLALTVGLPSVGHLIDQPFVLGGFRLDAAGSGGAGLLLVLLLMLAAAFVQAGFIGLLAETTAGRPAGFNVFSDYGRRFWGRMLALMLLVTLTVLLFGFLAMALGVVGLLLFLVGFTVLRIIYIFWEFTVVVEDRGLGEAFALSREYYARRHPETGALIGSILGLGLLAALALNLFWSLPALLVAIFGYNYLATGLQLALMNTFRATTEGGTAAG